MRNNLQQIRRSNFPLHRLGLPALFLPVLLSGCMNGPESLAAAVHPRELAEDMHDPVPPVLARLYQPDPPAGDSKPAAQPPAAPPLEPPSPSAFPGLVRPPASALSIPNASRPLDNLIKVRAWVNGKPLYDDEFALTLPKQLIVQLQYTPNDPKVKEAIATYRDKLVDSELMYQDAVNKLAAIKSPALDKLKKEAGKKFDETMREIRQAFKKENAHLSPAEFHKKENDLLEQLRQLNTLFRRKVEREFISREYMMSRVGPHVIIIVGAKEVREEYDAHPNMYVFPGKIKWQDVFIPLAEHGTMAETKRFAQELLARHRNDFNSLIPFDKGDSRHRGGYGIGSHPSYKQDNKVVQTDIRPLEMEGHLAKLNVGDSTVVETSTGVHIIRLALYEASRPRAFTQDVQMEIRNRLRNEVFEREVKFLVRDLRSRADIVMVAD